MKFKPFIMFAITLVIIIIINYIRFLYFNKVMEEKTGKTVTFVEFVLTR